MIVRSILTPLTLPYEVDSGLNLIEDVTSEGRNLQQPLNNVRYKWFIYERLVSFEEYPINQIRNKHLRNVLYHS